MKLFHKCHYISFFFFLIPLRLALKRPKMSRTRRDQLSKRTSRYKLFPYFFFQAQFKIRFSDVFFFSIRRPIMYYNNLYTRTDNNGKLDRTIRNS